MGNSKIASECCSDRTERQQKMGSRFERPEFNETQVSQTHSPLLQNTGGLGNSSLEKMRCSYDKNLLKDIERTLAKTKSQAMFSDSSRSVRKKRTGNEMLSEKSASSTFGDVEKIQIFRIENRNTLMNFLKKKDMENGVNFFFTVHVSNLNLTR